MNLENLVLNVKSANPNFKEVYLECEGMNFYRIVAVPEKGNVDITYLDTSKNPSLSSFSYESFLKKNYSNGH